MMVRPSGDDRRQFPLGDVKLESWERRPPENPPKEDMVTLSKSQLQQIWSAIHLPNAFEDGKQMTAGEEKTTDHPHHKPNGVTMVKDSCPPLPNASQGNNQVQAPCPLDVLVPCQASLSWSAPPTELSPNKLSPLSKVEQKRLQWEREKAEMNDWNPWGKPGAGAPVKKMQVVAPITPGRNNQLLMVHTSAAVPYINSVPASLPSCLPSPSLNRILPLSMEPAHFPPDKQFPNYSYVSQPVKPVPPVFKSSIAFGNGDCDSVSGEYFKRQQWLRDLDLQREEQRRFQEHVAQAAEPDWMNNCREETESISVSVDGCIQPNANDMHKRNYTRGQGFQLDPESAAEAEERRVKAQKYQQEIRLQMEEKQRKLQAERERKRIEEEEEERRLEAERAQIKSEYEQEQRRLKQKAELDEKKHQVLVSAMQQAQAQAEMEKKSRKIHRLLPLVPEANQTVPATSPGREAEHVLELSPQEPHHSPERTLEVSGRESRTSAPAQSTQADDTQSDSQSDSTSSGKKELGVQTNPVNLSNANGYSGYVVDRVLTPSIFRVRAKRGHGRDFGTQTDIHYGKFVVDDAESTESNTSSFHSPVGKRLTRVQYSKPYRIQRRPNDLVVSCERPKWGANQPSKSYIRMTERDPHFTKRKKMQELRKQHWEREMATQQAIRNARKAPGGSYPCLRGRRAISSSDCTMGYSSSEFETRSCSQFRSNSTPRLQHPSVFRSDCGGSADNLAYLTNHHNQYAYPAPRSTHSRSSDNLPSIVGGSEPTPSRHYHDPSTHSIPDLRSNFSSNSLPPMMRRRWHSQEAFPAPWVNQGAGPSFRLQSTGRRKWSDQESFDLDSVVRTRVAEGSRGSSGGSSEKSDSVVSSAGSSRGKSPSTNQNPLVRPEVITGRPTPRQDRILQNLSSLRQGLMKKQQELESLIRRPPHYLS